MKLNKCNINSTNILLYYRPLRINIFLHRPIYFSKRSTLFNTLYTWRQIYWPIYSISYSIYLINKHINFLSSLHNTPSWMRWPRNCIIYFSNLLPKQKIISRWNGDSSNKSNWGRNNLTCHRLISKPRPLKYYIHVVLKHINPANNLYYPSCNNKKCPNTIFQMTPSRNSRSNPSISPSSLIYLSNRRGVSINSILLIPFHYSHI